MSYKTIEVELADGHVFPSGAEVLPPRALALLTLLDERTRGPAENCAELADRWAAFHKLPPDEAEAFAADIESARASLPVLRSQWE